MDEQARKHNFDFHFLDRKRALFYHLVFHHSTPLHINHMIFLHTNFISLVLVTVIFSMYACVIIRPLHFTALYTLGILVLAAVAFVFEAYLSSTYDLQKWAIGAIGGGVVLASFVCQLLGHALYEDFTASPNLIHGFLAAPILEFQCFLYRWKLSNPAEYVLISEEVTLGRKYLWLEKHHEDDIHARHHIISANSHNVSLLAE